MLNKVLCYCRMFAEYNFKNYIMYLQKTLSILLFILTLNVFAQDNKNFDQQKITNTPNELFESAMNSFYGNLVPKDIPKAIDLFKQAAEKGHLTAQLNLTKIYYRGYKVQKGYHVRKNSKKAFYWATIAANQNNSEAQCYLGEMYLKGKGTRKDIKTGVTWILKAKNQGSVTASHKWDHLNSSEINS